MSGRFNLEAIFSGTDKLSSVVGKISTSYSRMASAAKGPFRELSKLNDQLIGKFEGIAVKGVKAAAALGMTGVTAGIVGVTKAGADFEQAITNVGAVSLMARNQIADLEAKALKLGRTTKFSATEAANAMEMMGKAGFTNAQIIQGIDGVLSAAAAEGIGLEETASHVSNVLKGMGLDGENMGQSAVRVADVLTLASARTNSSISSLGESMANVASTARQLNVPLEQVVAGVAMLQDVGIDAATAGSALNTMLTQMAAPSSKAATEMARWGIKFKDAHGNMLPFMDVLGQLSKASKKAGGNFDQVAFFAELVGLRGQKAASNLKDLFDSGKYQALSTELANAAGSAAKMAAIRMDTLQGDLTLLKSAAEGVAIGLFDLESGPLRDVVKQTTEWLNANKDLIKTKTAEYIHDIAAAIPVIADRAERLWPVVKVLGEMSAGIWAINRATKAWVLVAEMNPVVRGFTLALIAATALVEFWPEIKSFWQDNKLAISLVGEALGGLAIAVYGPKGVNAAMAAAGDAVGITKKGVVALQGAFEAVNAMSFTTLLANLGAVAFLAGSVAFLIQQIEKFNAENKGGITGTIGNMVTYGTWNPFEANDEAANDEARHEAANRPSLVAPRARVQGNTDWANGLDGADGADGSRSVSELVITDQSGKAKWKTPPKKGSGITLKPSGAY